jgi:hypothetical protein
VPSAHYRTNGGITTFGVDNKATITSLILDAVSTTALIMDTTDLQLWISLILIKARNDRTKRKTRVVKGRTSLR